MKGKVEKLYDSYLLPVITGFAGDSKVDTNNINNQ